MRSVVAATALAILGALPAPAQPAGAALSEREIRLALETWDAVREQLRETRAVLASLDAARAAGAPQAEIERLARTETVGVIRERIKQARRLLSRHVASPPVEFDRLFELIRGLYHTRAPAQRVELMREWEAKLAPLPDAIADLLPPLVAVDHPNDKGKEIVLGWKPQPAHERLRIERYDATRAAREGDMPESDDANWERVVELPRGATAVTRVDGGVKPGHRYKYRLRVGDAERWTDVVVTTGVVVPRANLFNFEQRWYLAIVIVFSGSVVFYIELAKRGVDLRIRKIAGLEAVEESVGRATEMGRSILFIPGIQDMNDIQTVAGIIILGRVAKVAAEHDAILEVPTSKSLVMTTARETVATSYLNAGRPDAYDEKRVYYITDEQFGYVAAVTGTMVREKPAACIYMGAFFAESLILAETANTVGSIQIAGTAQPAQLPFFVAACDYTLIGEEFFAASAYLSGEPDQLGSLKGQDVGKLIVLLLLAVGTVLATVVSLGRLQYTLVDDYVHWIKDTILNVAS